MKNFRKCIYIFLFFTLTLFADHKDYKFNATFGIATQSSILSKFKDAKVVLKSWIESLSESYDGEVKVKFYDTTNILYEDFKSKKIDIAAVDLKFYFRNKSEIERISEKNWALLVGEKQYKRYYLLGNKDKKLKGFGNLRNKTISLKNSDSNAKLWLDKESLELNRVSSDSLLKKIIFSEKDRTVLLNLFFGRTDYAIVEEEAWNVILEFNPAIKKRVEIISKSPTIFLEFIGFFSKDANPDTSKVFFDISKDLSKVKGSKTITEMLKFDSVYHISDESLKETDKYFQEYFNLKKKYK